ncbi:hypothetical protein KY290_017806 [Solanum tuberosum]|uniref:Uncharacterized protein n=1 Tax=Solanum tuberosum TaxID=4113 RepID=A0ABQ7VCB8_SOLTU|nr:hypothetical protein KY290_017806 [Solanum tuberosum]
MGLPIVLPHAESDEAAGRHRSTSKMNKAEPWRHPSLHRFAAMCNATNARIVGSSGQKVLDLDLSEFDWVMNVNARGHGWVKHAARAMVEKRVVLRQAGEDPGRLITHNVGTRCFRLVRSASKQLVEYGIRVNSISPSAVMTPLMISTEAEVSMKVLKKYGPQTSLKVITLMVKHLAEAALFLASDDSAFASGHDLGVDGGLISLPDPMSSLLNRENKPICLF